MNAELCLRCCFFGGCFYSEQARDLRFTQEFTTKRFLSEVHTLYSIIHYEIEMQLIQKQRELLIYCAFFSTRQKFLYLMNISGPCTEVSILKFLLQLIVYTYVRAVF